MEGKTVSASGGFERTITAIVDRADTAGERAGKSAGWNDGGDAAVFDCNNAADSLRAIAQRGRATYHFNAIGRVWVYCKGMVFRQRGCVVRANAVFLDADAIGVEAANDGAVRAGGERRASDAWLILKGVCNRRARLGQEFALWHDCHREERVICCCFDLRRKRLWFELGIAE